MKNTENTNSEVENTGRIDDFTPESVEKVVEDAIRKLREGASDQSISVLSGDKPIKIEDIEKAT